METGGDAQLVERVRSGDSAAFAPLFERWHDRVYNVAYGVVRNPETAADVAQDTFIAAWQRLDRLENAESFGGWLLRIARNKALNTLHRERRSTPIEGDTVTALHDRGLPDPAGASRPPETPEVAEIHDRHELLWAASAALGERDASVLDLHLRHGLTPAELAADLGVEANNAHQVLFRLRKRLEDAVGSFLLWRRGTPTCPELRHMVGSTFDAGQVSVIRRHEKSCDRCSDERRRQTRPAALFSAVPMVAVPLAFRARAASGLEAAGVPMPDVTPSAGRGPGPETSATGSDPSGETSTGSVGDAPGGDGPPGIAAGGGDGTGHGDGDDMTGDGGPGDDGAGESSGHGGGADDDHDDDDDGDDEVADPTHRARWLAMGAAAAAIIAAITFIAVSNAGKGPGTSELAITPGDDVVAIAPTTSTASTPAAVTSTTSSSTATTPTVPVAGPSTTDPATTPPVVTVPPSLTSPAPPTPPEPGPATTAAPPSRVTDPPPPTRTEPPEPTTIPPSEPPPAIVRFGVDAGSQACGSDVAPSVARWVTQDATSVTLAWPDGSAAEALSGSRELCLVPGDAVTLTAVAPDGRSVTETAVAPASP